MGYDFSTKDHVRKGKALMYRRIQWLFATSLLLIVFSAWGLSLAYERFAPKKELNLSLLMESAGMFVAPEPVERFVFLILLLAVPVMAMGSVLGGAFRSLQDEKEGHRRLDVILAGSLALLFYLPFYLAPFSRVLMGWVGLEKSWAEKLTLLALALGSIWAWLVVRRVGRHPASHRSLSVVKVWIGVAVGVACLSPLLAYRIVDFSQITDSAVWSDHLDAVIYPLSQVMAGRTLLVDLPSQYGLFPELLSLPFRFLPVSLLNVSLVFGVMQIISMLAVLAVLFRYVRSRFLLVVASFALVMVTYGTSGASGFRWTEADPYFQYWPIRFFWPALSVYLFDRFLRHRHCSWQRLLLPVVGTALALIWNLDTGLAVLYAATMTTLCIGLLQWRGTDSARLSPGFAGHLEPMRWLLTAGVFPLVSIAAMGLLLLLLFIKAGLPLQMQWIGAYQSTFYGLGFFMIPLPLPFDAWMAVLAIYLLGMVVALVTLQSNSGATWAGTLLYLSLLGAGLFIYYQGRSHFFNLVSVAWPAVVIGAMLTDRHLRGLQKGLLPRASAVIPAFALSLLLVPALGFLGGIPEQWKLALARRMPQPSSHRGLLQSELDLIRRHCPQGSSCLILAKRQGIYALEAGVASPWKGPGTSELLLANDRTRLVSNLLNGRYDHVFLGVGPVSYLPSLALPMQAILRRYELIDQNPLGSLIYLRPRSSHGRRILSQL